MDVQLPGQAPDQGLGIRADRDQLGDGPPALGDHDPVRVDPVEEREVISSAGEVLKSPALRGTTDGA